MQPDAARSGRMPLVAGYTWDGSRRSGRRNEHVWARGKLCATQGRVYAGVGDAVAVVEALGVDPEQHLDAVPGALGDPGRGAPPRLATAIRPRVAGRRGARQALSRQPARVSGQGSGPRPRRR